MSLESITKQIREEISKLNQVLHLLEGRAKKTTRAKAPHANYQPQAGKRIAAAQRARWAKIKAAKK
jgi:hypothetical protein